jgi:YD repeat-containing protein
VLYFSPLLSVRRDGALYREYLYETEPRRGVKIARLTHINSTVSLLEGGTQRVHLKSVYYNGDHVYISRTISSLEDERLDSAFYTSYTGDQFFADDKKNVSFSETVLDRNGTQDTRYKIQRIHGKMRVTQIEGNYTEACMAPFSTYKYNEQGDLLEQRTKLRSFYEDEQERVTRYIYGQNGALVGTLTNPDDPTPAVTLLHSDPETGQPLYVHTQDSTRLYQYNDAHQLIRISRLPNDPANSPLNQDADHDGTRNLEELQLGQDPFSAHQGQAAALPTPTKSAIHTQFEYENGLLKAIDGPLTGQNDRTEFAYHSNGDLASIIKPQGVTTEYQNYNSHGLPETILLSTGIQYEFRYDPWLLVPVTLTETGANNQQRVTELTYNEVGQLLKIQSPEPTNWHINHYNYTKPWNNFATLVQQENSSGDHLYRQANQGYGGGIQWLYTNPEGWSYQHLRIKGHYGNLIYQESPAFGAMEREQHYRYNSEKQLIGIGDRPRTGSDEWVRYYYDRFGRLSGVSEAMRDQHQYQYNPQQQLAKIIAANGVQTAYDYNGFGRVQQRDSADTGRTQYQYNAAGDLTRLITEAGQQDFSYDAANRLLSKTYTADASLNQQWRYDQPTEILKQRFNNRHQLSQITQGNLLTEFGYDDFGDLSAWQRTDTKVHPKLQDSMLLTRNKTAHITRIQHPEGQFDYELDGSGRIQKIFWSTAKAEQQTLIDKINYMAFTTKLGRLLLMTSSIKASAMNFFPANIFREI